jgi:hypothetical protein
LEKLKDIFDTAEDMLSLNVLFSLFYIYKYMISLGDNKLIETLLSPEHYTQTFGALECKSIIHLTFYIDDPELYNVSQSAD